VALDDSGLDTALQIFMLDNPPTTAEAAANLADIYDAYCQDAMFAASTPTLTGRRAMFEAAVAASLSSGVFATVCTAIGNGVLAYWTGVPVVGPQTGAVPTCPGAAAIAGALAVLAPMSSKDVAASTLAAALATATRTCQAAITAPAPATVPIA
jgi:hypothetical protein